MGTNVTDMVTSDHVERAKSLFGATRRAVLGLLLGRPDEKFHLRQVVRLTGTGVGPVQRELAALVSAGVVRREQSGRQVYFQAETRSPVIAELTALIVKISGAAGILHRELLPFLGRIRAAVIFGSTASSGMNRNSDVDLLVISDDLNVRDLGGALRSASSRLGRDVSLNLYRPSEWSARAKRNHPLVRSILKQPRITLIGEPGELERMAEERMA